jgi:hypothetical protein
LIHHSSIANALSRLSFIALDLQLVTTNDKLFLDRQIAQ